MKKIILFYAILLSTIGYSQSKTFIDQPYIETKATADTLVSPDRIYLNILISEKDTKGKKSLEEIESIMILRLKNAGIDIKKQLTLSDLSSNFKSYFLKRQDIQKAKLYSLLVYDANTAGKIMADLEEENISNVTLVKTEYSKLESLKLDLKSLACLKAKQNALSMAKPFNQKVGIALFISDSEPNLSLLSGRVAGVQVRGVSSFGYYDSKNEESQIEFEKIKVSVSVNVAFKLD